MASLASSSCAPTLACIAWMPSAPRGVSAPFVQTGGAARAEGWRDAPRGRRKEAVRQNGRMGQSFVSTSTRRFRTEGCCFRAWKRSSAEVVQMSEWLFREWNTHGYRNRDPIGGPLVQVGVQRWCVWEEGGEDLWRVGVACGCHELKEMHPAWLRIIELLLLFGRGGADLR